MHGFGLLAIVDQFPLSKCLYHFFLTNVYIISCIVPFKHNNIKSI